MAVYGRDRRGNQVTDKEVPQQRFDEIRAEQVAGSTTTPHPERSADDRCGILASMLVYYARRPTPRAAVIFLLLLGSSTAHAWC